MIVAVIPCYRVRNRILDVLGRIGPEVSKIYVVDDACPEHTGDFVKENTADDRIEVLFHRQNLGVGGAVKTGYLKALGDGASVIVKIDGDGQMDPAFIGRLIGPLVKKEADYVKGNRFYSFSYLSSMPATRKLGNSLLSFVNKVSSGYWNVMDPTNGFTAIHSVALKDLPLEKISDRFFFESDMLFRLNTIRAVVTDVPVPAIYGNEKSNLKIRNVIFSFPFLYLNRFCKRIFYNYFLRDFNIGSLELILAFIFLSFGFIFGAMRWAASIETARPATAGTVLLAGLPVILGFQSLISFLHFDLTNIPHRSINSLTS